MSTDSPRGRILVVDDVPTNIAVVNEVLGGEHDVLFATNGVDALRLARAQQPDLILLDVVMPGMDGYQVCEALKAAPETRSIPVVFITSMSEEEDETRGLGLGAIDYVVKPFSPPIVRARVRNHLELRRRELMLNATNRKLDEAYSRLSRDLEMASTLQRSLLPEASATIGGLRFDHVYQPSQFLGGDSLNYFRVSDHFAVFYIADVAGHGVPSALMSVSLATTLTPEFCAGTRPADSVFDLPSPARQMQHLNERFLSSTGELGYFTAAYGIIDTATGRGVLCQAGQPSPLIIASDGSVRTLGDGGFVIGLVEEAEFEDQPFELHPGERLVLYSDGISECENADRQPFGEDRLAEMLAADVSLDAIVDALRLWRDGRPYDDDLSMLRVSRAG